jgi:hypothetical protein
VVVGAYLVTILVNCLLSRFQALEDRNGSVLFSASSQVPGSTWHQVRLQEIAVE